MADDCYAIPFVNDTHLANDPARDPDFDEGLPRSEFQQAFSYRLPNLREYGGVFPRAGQSGDLPRRCERGGPPRPPGGGGPADHMRVLSERAAVDRRGRFSVHVRCPRGAPAPCRGKLFVSKAGDRLAKAEFGINRRTTARVDLKLRGRAFARLVRRGELGARVDVVPSDRSVVRDDTTARVRLVWRPGRAQPARLTRRQARQLVAKYRVIAENWNK